MLNVNKPINRPPNKASHARPQKTWAELVSLAHAGGVMPK